jgi:abhydrolase domain-containing protein 6
LPEIKVRGASISYRQRGKGEPLLLVHGWNASSAMWMLNLRGLSSGRRVIAVDLPGHGDSGLPEGFEPDLPGYAEFLEDLRRALFLPTLDLVGHSMGGCISLLYALRHPDRVSRLVLMDTPSRRQALNRLSRVASPRPCIRLFYRMRGPRLNAYMFKRALLHPEKVPDEVVEENLRRSSGISWEIFRSTTSSVRSVSIDPGEIAALGLPVLLLWGDRDKTVSKQEAYRLKQLLPRANLALVPAAGHSPQLEAPGLVEGLILEFLEGPS